MSSTVATADPSDVKKADTKMQHGLLSDSQDMLADLAVGEPALPPTATAKASSDSIDAGNEQLSSVAEGIVKDSAVTTAPAEPDGAAVDLTPEQDAAAAVCAEEFVESYELAFLSRAVCQLAESCKAKGIPESAVANKLRAKGIVLQDLKDRAAEVERGIAECASDEGWRLIQDGKLRLMYRHETGSTVHCFKGSCCLPGPMEQPLSMAREFDLVNSWNSYITNSKILRTFCDIDLLVYASVWFPWPFVERDVLISAFADDRLKDKGVVAVSFASPTQTPPGVGPDLPSGADQRVHVYFTSGSCMTMTPLPAPPATVTVHSSTSGGDAQVAAANSKQQTQVVIVANIETGMAHVPEAVIQFVLRVFAPFMYSTVLKVLHSTFDDPNQALPQRLAEHHELYDMLRQRCQAYLDGHPE